MCAVAAQPGHTKDLQSGQLEQYVLLILQESFLTRMAMMTAKESTKKVVLLRNVVKVEDVEDPIAVGECIPALSINFVTELIIYT